MILENTQTFQNPPYRVYTIPTLQDFAVLTPGYEGLPVYIYFTGINGPERLFSVLGYQNFTLLFVLLAMFFQIINDKIHKIFKRNLRIKFQQLL